MDSIIFQFYPVNSSYLRNLYFFDIQCHRLGVEYTLLAPKDFSLPPGITSAKKVVSFDNKGGDFFALADYLSEFQVSGCLSIVNSSMLGPVFTDSATSRWPHSQTQKITSKIQLVGDSVNNLPNLSFHGLDFMLHHGPRRTLSHVQTGSFTIGPLLLSELRDSTFFRSGKRRGKVFQVRNFEILMSDKARRFGFGIDSIGDYKQGSSSTTDPYDSDIESLLSQGYEFIKTSRGTNNEGLVNRLGHSCEIQLAESKAIANWPIQVS